MAQLFRLETAEPGGTVCQGCPRKPLKQLSSSAVSDLLGTFAGKGKQGFKQTSKSKAELLKGAFFSS